MKGNLLLAALLASHAVSATANAMEYPYCSAGGGFSSHGSCGFTSLEQCRATVMGAGGYCQINPAYNAGRAVPSVPLRSREVGFQRRR